MRHWRHFTLALAILPMLAMPALGEGDAGHESPFTIGPGARSIGMGGGYTSLSTDGSAVYFNPASLAFLEYQEVLLMHTLLFEGTSYSFASWVHPTSPRSGVGIGFMRLGTGDIIRRQDYLNIGTFDYSISQLILSFGQRLGTPLALGANVRIVNQSLEDMSAYGFAFDFGLRTRLYRNLAAGVIVRDAIPGNLDLGTRSEEPPPTIVAGISVDQAKLSSSFLFSAAFDIQKVESQDVKIKTGVEVDYNRTLALRLGYNRDNFVVGAGFSREKILIDYALKLVDDAANSHHFSISFRFGESVSSRLARQRALVPATPPLSPEELEKLRLRELGNRYFHRFALDSALVVFNQLLTLDTTDHDVKATISAIENALQTADEQQSRLLDAELERDHYLRSFHARAQLFFTDRNYAAALDFVNLILDTQPDHVAALNLRDRIVNARAEEIKSQLDTARVATTTGRSVRAIEAYNRVLELDPELESAADARQQVLQSLDLPQQLNLGISLFERGRLIAAQRQFRRILNSHPGQPVANDYLQKIAAAAKPPEETGATLEDLQKDPEAWKYYTDGLRYMRDLQYDQAIQVWLKVLEVFPNNQNTLDNIEQARLRLGNANED